MLENLCHLQRLKSLPYEGTTKIKTSLQTCNIHKLQVCKAVSIEFVLSKRQKSFRDQMAKNFHICKWISFAISTFVILEEIAYDMPKVSVIIFGRLFSKKDHSVWLVHDKVAGLAPISSGNTLERR